MKRFICYYKCDYGTKEVYLICDNDEQMIDYMKRGLYDFRSDYLSDAFDYWYSMWYDEYEDEGFDTYELFLNSSAYDEFVQDTYFEYYRSEDDKVDDRADEFIGFFGEYEWKAEKAIDIREEK